MAKWPVLCVLSTLMAASGCGDDGRAQMAPPNNSSGGTPVSSGGTEKTDSGTGDSGTGQTGGVDETGGMNDTGGVMDPDGGVPDGSIDDGGFLDPARLFPVVSFLSPDAATVHDSPDVVTDRTITVRCSATASEVDGALPINEGKVAITMLASVNSDPFSSAAVDTVGVRDKVAKGEFESEFNLEEYPNGPLAFMCSASDTASPPNEAVTELQTLLDLGPIIQIDSPLSGSILSLKQPVFVTFSASESPITDPDPGAEIASVTLDIPGARRTIELSPGVEANQYTASIDFDDRNLFDAAPATAELVFKATNKRAPGTVTRTERVNISLDGVGPTLSITSPNAGQIVRGEITLRIEATDPSGVALDRLIARIPDPLSPGGVLVLSDWLFNAGEYTHRFDTNALDPDRSQVIINIDAFDMVGNQSTSDLHLVLDNRAPLISLNPPTIREALVGQGEDHYCTFPFDPVGNDAVNDLDIAAGGSILPRVIAWDLTNSSSGVVDYYSGTNEDDVSLFMRPADGTPLLVNAAGTAGQLCDDINSVPGGTATAPTQWSMGGLQVGGRVSSDPDGTDVGGPCTLPGTGAAENFRCQGAMARRTAQNTFFKKPVPPGVFAFNPSDKVNVPACDGNSIVITDHFAHTGWYCIAVRASDYVGNVGVSAPLRVWIEAFSGDYPGPQDAPSCTDGCVPPPNLPEDQVYYAQ